MMHEKEDKSIQQAKGERRGALFGLFNALVSIFPATRTQGKGIASLVDVFVACVKAWATNDAVERVEKTARLKAHAESTAPFYSM